MEDTNLLKKKFTAVIKAAVWGVIVADGMILILALEYKVQRHLPKLIDDFFTGISFLLAIPSAMISSAVNFQGGLLNEYAVNGIVGAVSFGGFAAIWQFLLKHDHEK